MKQQIKSIAVNFKNGICTIQKSTYPTLKKCCNPRMNELTFDEESVIEVHKQLYCTSSERALRRRAGFWNWLTLFHH